MSRATELGLKHPCEVTHSLYKPKVTHFGTGLTFKTRHVSRERM